MPSTDLRERLDRAASRLDVAPPPVPAIVRRGRRRVALRVAAATTCVVVVGATIAWSIASLIALAPGNGRRPRPLTTPSIATVPLTTTVLPEGPTAVTTVGRSVFAIGNHGAIMLVNPTKGHARVVSRLTGVDSISSGGGYLWAWPFMGGLARLNPHESVVLTPAGPNRPPPNLETTPVPIPGSAVDVAYGLGSLWVTTDRHTLLRIDPSRGRVEGHPTAIPGDPDLNVSPPVAVAGSSVWIGGGGNGTVIRVRPAGHPRVTVLRLSQTATRTSQNPGNYSGASYTLLAGGRGVLWACCDGRSATREIDATAGRVLPGALATPACIAGPWDDMVAGQWLWTYAGSSGCVPDGATPSAEVFRVVPSASAPYAGGTFDPSTARLQGPALTRTAEGGMTIANGRVWVTNFDPPKVVSFQALAPLPDWTETRASTAWWVRWGWLLVGLTALILVGGALLRLRRRGELTAR